MLKNIPGTVLEWNDALSQNAFAVLSPVLSVTKGLTLSQLKELTGLEGSTIQNWVKRGWVERPSGKRYGEQQIVRIILINMLRSSMQLEKIIALMRYINGEVDDRSDDIIPDRRLFSVICSVISQVDKKQTVDKEIIKEIIENELTDSSVRTRTQSKSLRVRYFVWCSAFSRRKSKKRQKQNFQSFLNKEDFYDHHNHTVC